MECGVWAEAIPPPARDDLAGATPQARPSCLEFREGIQRTLTNTPHAKKPWGPNHFWSDSNVSLLESFQPEPFPVKLPTLNFCWFSVAASPAKKKVKWAGLFSGLSAWEGSRDRDPLCLANGAESGVHWGGREVPWGARCDSQPAVNPETEIRMGGKGGGWKKVQVLATQSCPLLATPWTVAHQVPLSMGFSRQEYWSGLPFPSPGVLPDLGMEPFPALRADSLPSEPPGKPPGAEIRLKDRMTPKLGRGFFSSCWSPWAPLSGPFPSPSQVYTGLHLNPHLLS